MSHSHWVPFAMAQEEEEAQGTMHDLNGFGKFTAPQNRQLIAYYFNKLTILLGS